MKKNLKKKNILTKWRRYNWMVEWSQSQKEKMYFWKLGSYCCISPVLSICRFKITDAVILLWWMIKLQICGTRFSGFVFGRQPTFFTFCEVALSYNVLRKVSWWEISGNYLFIDPSIVICAKSCGRESLCSKWYFLYIEHSKKNSIPRCLMMLVFHNNCACCKYLCRQYM